MGFGHDKYGIRDSSPFQYDCGANLSDDTEQSVLTLFTESNQVGLTNFLKLKCSRHFT